MATFAVVLFSTFEICACIALGTGNVSMDYLPFSATWAAIVLLKAIVVFLGDFSTMLRAFCLVAAIFVCMYVAQQLGFLPTEHFV
jgi:hypothetical protein